MTIVAQEPCKRMLNLCQMVRYPKNMAANVKKEQDAGNNYGHDKKTLVRWEKLTKDELQMVCRMFEKLAGGSSESKSSTTNGGSSDEDPPSVGRAAESTAGRTNINADTSSRSGSKSIGENKAHGGPRCVADPGSSREIQRSVNPNSHGLKRKNPTDDSPTQLLQKDFASHVISTPRSNDASTHMIVHSNDLIGQQMLKVGHKAPKMNDPTGIGQWEKLHAVYRKRGYVTAEDDSEDKDMFPHWIPGYWTWVKKRH